MKSKKINTILSILLLGILAISCTSTPEASSEQTSSEVESIEQADSEPASDEEASSDEQTSNEQVNVTVSIVPEKYFVERVGGEYVTVNIMVGPGESPHTYEPKAEQMTALSESALYFSIGVEFDNVWMEKIAATNPDMQIVNLSANLEKIPMASSHDHEGEEAEESAEETEEEGSLDPHVWTSPENAKVMAETICQKLSEVDPAHETDYQANLATFQQDIDELEDEIEASLQGITSNKFMVFHPAWGYFARDFGLEQIAIEIEGSEPSAQELAGIIDEAKEENIQVVFAQPEFSTKTADYIAEEINGQVILISPLSEDWLENLRNVGSTFAEVLKSDNG